MLIVGLTGGIASGKSTVAGRFAELGARVVDADALSREVVAPGTPGMTEVVREFGAGVLTPQGTLDRPALGRLVFTDRVARERLESIIHPAVGRRFSEIVASSPPDTVVVHDIPLLVEKGLGARYHLVVVVDVPAEVRRDRLVETRGITLEEAEHRIAAQASDPERRAAADVMLANDRPVAETLAAVDELWHERLVPFEENVRLRRRAPRGPAAIVPPPVADPWPAQAERVLARLRRAGGAHVLDAHHIGSTAVPGLAAKDVLDLQVGVASLSDADEMADALADAGFAPTTPGLWHDTPKPGHPDPADWQKRYHASSDPDRPVNLHVRVTGSPGWRFALAFRDWLRADPGARSEYETLKRSLSRESAGRPRRAYAELKEPWFTEVAAPRLEDWIDGTGWRPPSG